MIKAASVALHNAGSPIFVVVEGPAGPRFPNGVVTHGSDPTVTGTGWFDGVIRSRRWWDPTLPDDELRPDLVTRFVSSVEPIALPAPPEDCVGWGPGLTPAGDDVLVGMLLALRAIGDDTEVDQLATKCASAETSPLSRSLIDHAARGEAVRPLLDLFAALAGRGDLGVALNTLRRFGASSGQHVVDGVRRVLTGLPVGVSP